MSEELLEHIEELQIRQSFQEDALQKMNEQMAALTMKLALAQDQIRLLSDKIKNNSENDGHGGSDNERPPHY